MQRRAHQFDDGPDRLADIDHGGLQRLATSDGQKPPHQVGATPRGADGRLQHLRLQGRIVDPGDERRQIAENDGQEIVEVVGDAGRKLAERLHLLGLQERRRGLLLLGDVHRQHVEAARRAVGVAVGPKEGARVENPPVRKGDLLVEVERLAGLGAGEERPHAGHGGGAQHLVMAPAGDRIG